MIKYDRLWSTLKEREISQYRLIKDFGIDKAQLHRLRKNMVVKTMILNNLGRILNCRIEDIMEDVPSQDPDERGNADLDLRSLFFVAFTVPAPTASCPSRVSRP